MSDEDQTTPEVQDPQPPADPPATVDWEERAKKAEAEAERWKGFSRKNEDVAKANAEAAKKLRAIEDRDLSELQKAQRDAEEWRKRAEETERHVMRQQVALDKGIPADLVEALAGSTPDELNAHAEKLLAWRGAAPKAPEPPKPQQRPDRGQGARPGVKADSGVAAGRDLYAARKKPGGSTT